MELTAYLKDTGHVETLITCFHVVSWLSGWRRMKWIHAHNAAN